MRVERIADDGRQGVRATFVDDGPGIADLDAALTDGFSTIGNLGLGLGGARRLVDEMTVVTEVNSGTRVVITTWSDESGGLSPS